MEKHVALQDLIKFLENPASYPHHPKEVKIIQTHGSVLAMASPYVYKFKKPFDFGFMDFRRLEARKDNSEKELALNRRLCKEVYLNVLPLYQEADQLSFQEKGRVVDYALQMKQMEDGYFLHQKLQKGELNTALLDKVLQVLQKFYKGQPPRPEIHTYADTTHLKQNAEENFSSLRDFTKSKVARESLRIIEQEMKAFLKNQEELFEKRLQESKIKDCHGDLHLEHIHIKNNRVCIFDCIEFNDRFRYSDVAADIAFLAMDLDFADRPDLAGYVGNSMAELLQDDDILPLMDYYKSYRACVRAKVEGIRSLQEEVKGEEQEHSRQRAEKYLQLALRYQLLGSSPVLMIVCGKIGTGKSTIARQLAEQLGIQYLSSDYIRKSSAGLALHQRTDAAERPQLYGEQKTAEVYKQLLSNALAALQKQQSLVVDATFTKKSHRQRFMQALEQQSFAYCFVETQAPDQLIRERLKEREEKAVVSDARLEDFEKLSQAFEPLREVPASRHIHLNTKDSPEESQQKLLKALAARKGAFKDK